MDIEWIRSYLIGFLSSLSATLVERYFRLLIAAGLPLGYRLHIRELTQKLKDMPFIYKDVDVDLLNDVVEIELETVDSQTLATRQQGRSPATSTVDRIKHRRRALFLGQAGVGKTTFFRQTVLTMNDRNRTRSFFFPKERLIPFYVPLKAIDNAAPYPILRYLLQSNSIIRGPHGKTRLLSLARQRRVFLLLDGYDEIPFPAIGKRDRNYIFDELRVILGATDPPSTDHGEEGLIYKAFERCRLWLSSRKEFYERYRLDTIDTKSRPVLVSDIMTVELKGIRNNRITLAGRIFSKYKRRSPKYVDLLSEEYFVQDIDQSPQQDLINLSSNPLFLTVMCYIYASKTIEHGTHKIPWAHNVRELVLECIRLLIADLDESKARGLPAAQRAALLRRRNSYAEEKLEFLKYFAADSILQNKAVISVDYLQQRTLDFFRTIAVSSEKAEIIRDLGRTESGVPNFVLQLILSGVFVIVDRRGSTILYDFPHRLFRDVLACDYFNNPGTVKYLLPKLDQQNLGEFVPFFFCNSAFQDEILQALLENMVSNSEDELLGLIVRNCLRNKPGEYDPSRVLGECFLKAMRSNSKFRMPIDVLDYFQPQTTILTSALQLLEGSIRGEKVGTNSLQLSASLLERFDRASLVEFLTRNMEKILRDNRLFGLLKYAILAEVPELARYLQNVFSTPEWIQLVPLVVKTSTSLRNALEFYQIWLGMLKLEDRIKVLAVLYDLDRALFFRVTGMENVEEDWEVCGAVIRQMKDQSKKPVDKREPASEYFYIVTRACISKASTTDERERLKKLHGRVYLDVSELLTAPAVPRTSTEEVSGEPIEEVSGEPIKEDIKKFILREAQYPTSVWRIVKQSISTLQYSLPDYTEIFTHSGNVGTNR